MSNYHLKNKRLRLKVKRLGINGEGIAYYKKTLVFIPYALPGEIVHVKVTQAKANYIEAQLCQIEKVSPLRVAPTCPQYTKCGACQLQHLSYEGQLQFKQDIIRQALDRYYKEASAKIELRPTLGMAEPYFYRNKLQFPVRQEENKIAMGLFKAGSHQLVAIKHCCVQDPLTEQIANTAFALIQQFQLPVYNEKTKQGEIKTIVVRASQATREAQLVFVTKSEHQLFSPAFLEALQAKEPQLVSIMQNIQSKASSEIMGPKTKHLAGQESICEHLEDQAFHLSARSFFQLNTKQTEILYQEVRKALQAGPEDIIIDAYCGVGTIGLTLAPYVKAVYGMDIIPTAIENAKENAQRFGLSNTHYEAGPAECLLPKWFAEGLAISGLVVDPPRTGLDRALLSALKQYPVEKFVYVSCNPSTLAKDLQTLSDFYEVQYIQSVDIFPQTARVEAVAALKRKK